MMQNGSFVDFNTSYLLMDFLHLGKNIPLDICSTSKCLKNCTCESFQPKSPTKTRVISKVLIYRFYWLPNLQNGKKPLENPLETTAPPCPRNPNLALSISALAVSFALSFATAALVSTLSAAPGTAYVGATKTTKIDLTNLVEKN